MLQRTEFKLTTSHFSLFVSVKNENVYRKKDSCRVSGFLQALISLVDIPLSMFCFSSSETVSFVVTDGSSRSAWKSAVCFKSIPGCHTSMFDPTDVSLQNNHVKNEGMGMTGQRIYLRATF
uniref:Putative acid methyltransferase n=1 Tax=Ixodes ricinus TaxID=34613 RepID=A0A0K8RJ09_IXORI